MALAFYGDIVNSKFHKKIYFSLRLVAPVIDHDVMFEQFSKYMIFIQLAFVSSLRQRRKVVNNIICKIVEMKAEMS